MNSPPVPLRSLYEAFNRRDIDGALLHMAENVTWPKASEGGCVTGRNAVREYWERQWVHFNPRVEPISAEVRDGRIFVRVHQIVRSADGEFPERLLFDGEVLHIFTMTEDQVQSMELGDTHSAREAFAHGK